MSDYQYLPSLSLDEYEALKESIRENGVIEPVIVDENGAIIDGHHRVKACEEIGIEYPTRTIEGLNNEQKQDLSLKLNMHRRHLTRDQKKELTIILHEKGWSQTRISKAFGVPQQTISDWLKQFQITEFGNLKPVKNTDEQKNELRKQIEYYEKRDKEHQEQLKELARTRKALEEISFDRNQAREEARTMAKELDALKNAAREKEVVEVEVKVVDASITATKVAELEKAKMEAETARLQLDKEREQLEKARERDAAHVDLKELEEEYRLLESKKRSIEAEIKAASIVEKIQRRLREEHDAFTHGAAILQIITQEIMERDDCAGLSVEELEQLERDIAKVGVCVKELIPAVHTLIEKIKNGGALRIV